MRKLVVLVAVVLAACSMSADTKLAEQAVAKFHEMLDAGQFEAIYALSGDDFKKVQTQASFIALLDALHRKLGDTKSSTQQSWKVNYNTSGTFVTLDYATIYTEGEATEHFVYRLQDKKALLFGYTINSNAFILK